MYVDGRATPEVVLNLVRRIISSELDIPADTFDAGASLRRKYELDSVAAINIIFALEQELDIEINPAVLAGIDSAMQIRDLLVDLLKH